MCIQDYNFIQTIHDISDLSVNYHYHTNVKELITEKKLFLNHLNQLSVNLYKKNITKTHCNTQIFTVYTTHSKQQSKSFIMNDEISILLL